MKQTLLALFLIPAVCGCGGLRDLVTYRSVRRSVRAVVLDATGLDAAVRGEFVGRIMAFDPDVQFLRGEVFPGTPSGGGWYVAVRRMRYAPAQVPTVPESSVFSRESGPVHFTIVNIERPETEEMLARIREQLSPAGRPWKVVLMTAPVFDAHGVREDMMPLVRLFERERVALVISAGGRSYRRIAPVGSAEDRVVRYVDGGAKGGAWVAAHFDMPYFGILDVTCHTLSWKVFDRSGRMVDSLTIERGAAMSRFWTVNEILAAEGADEQGTR